MSAEMEQPNVVLDSWQGGEDHCTTTLTLERNGAIRITSFDRGPTVGKFFAGAEDYTYWIDVPSDALPKLAFALLREKFAGNGKAVEELRAFCKKEGISSEENYWHTYNLEG